MSKLAKITGHVQSAAQKAGRDVSDITLIAVSKVQPLARIDAVLAAGHTDFGENRVQEAAGKWPERVAQYPETTLHLIGPLQSNKVRQAVELFDVIHTVDRPKIARRLADVFQETGRALPCFIQINIGEENQKSGCLPADADAFIEDCRKVLELPLLGLMCIPPAERDPVPYFTALRDIARRNGLDKLSMGMSTDYCQAIALGATHIRVGSALFGPRQAG